MKIFVLFFAIFLILFSKISHSAPIEITIEYPQNVTINCSCTDWSSCANSFQFRTCTPSACLPESQTCNATISSPIGMPLFSLYNLLLIAMAIMLPIIALMVYHLIGLKNIPETKSAEG